jgi:hypothetical protein
MKHWILAISLALLAGLSVSAQSKGLIGTSNSFAESNFCKKYRCNLVGRQQLLSNLEEWRYTYQTDFQLEVVTVLRSKGVIVSAGMTLGVQDNPFAVCCYTPIAQSLIQAMTGASITGGELEVLAETAMGASGRESRIGLLNKGSTAFLSVLFSSEFEGASRFSLRISQ